MMGILSEVGGVTSATIPRKTVTERRFVISINIESFVLSLKNIRRVIFSPHSGGMVNPMTLLKEIRIEGIIQFSP